MTFLRNIFTEMDNETYSSPRVVAFLLMAEFVGLSISDFVRNGHFDGQAFGLGAAALIAAMGAAIHMGEKP